MLDSLVRVSRRVWWKHLYSRSRGLRVHWAYSRALYQRNFKEVPSNNNTNTSNPNTRLSRVLCFLHQTSRFTRESSVAGANLSRPSFLQLENLMHLEAPANIVHPSLHRNSCAPFWHWKITQTFNKFRLRCRPYETLLPSASLSTVSRTFSLSFQSSFHLSLTVLVRYRSRVNI